MLVIAERLTLQKSRIPLKDGTTSKWRLLFSDILNPLVAATESAVLLLDIFDCGLHKPKIGAKYRMAVSSA
jgi:hypothetical protein